MERRGGGKKTAGRKRGEEVRENDHSPREKCLERMFRNSRIMFQNMHMNTRLSVGLSPHHSIATI